MTMLILHKYTALLRFIRRLTLKETKLPLAEKFEKNKKYLPTEYFPF